jgi:hypothetical protein
MKKMKSLFVGLGGEYFEGGYRYFHSIGTIEVRADGKCFLHGRGSLTQGCYYYELTPEKASQEIAKRLELAGTRDKTYGCLMELHIEHREVDVYDV